MNTEIRAAEYLTWFHAEYVVGMLALGNRQLAAEARRYDSVTLTHLHELAPMRAHLSIGYQE